MCEVRNYKGEVRRGCDDECCPMCGGELDTGFECNSCGFDALPLLKANGPEALRFKEKELVQ